MMISFASCSKVTNGLTATGFMSVTFLSAE